MDLPCSEERNPHQKNLEIGTWVCAKTFLKTFCKPLGGGCRIIFAWSKLYSLIMNPFHHARPTRAMAWRKPGQGFDFGFTGNSILSSNEGTLNSFCYTSTYNFLQ